MLANMSDMVQSGQESWSVILGDQIASKIVDDREHELIAQRQRLEEINSHCGKRLVVPFTSSGGDEIQALVATPGDAWEILETFDANSWLLQFRFTVGVGALSTGLQERTWEMDGPCFHRAREAMDDAKRERRWIMFRGLGERRDTQVNGVVRALQIIRDGWTKRQRVAFCHRRHAELQTVAAELMGLDQSTMSKMLKAAHYKEYLEIEGVLRSLLEAAEGEERA